MTGEEQVYALYVQANPIPDPAGLPLTLEPTEPLLQSVEDGRGIMLTEERSQTRAPTPKRWWQRPLAVAAAAFVLVLAVGAVAWWTASGDSGSVVAADADTVVTFDGEVITYDGPDSVVFGNVEFTFRNEHDQAASLVAWRFDDQAALDAELAQLGLGGEMPREPDTPTPADATRVFEIYEPAGGEEELRWLMDEGLYVMDVATLDYVWRADVIVEVVP